tara:strand:+ start:1566 stop:1859 length:294 start_codon:yes stop_codon:yes gene_type:complete
MGWWTILKDFFTKATVSSVSSVSPVYKLEDVSPLSTKKVNRYTRAGALGKTIECPICEHHRVVYNFSWGAIVCNGCKATVDKNDFFVVPEEKGRKPQ